jgi:hypothetical protein
MSSTSNHAKRASDRQHSTFLTTIDIPSYTGCSHFNGFYRKFENKAFSRPSPATFWHCLSPSHPKVSRIYFCSRWQCFFWFLWLLQKNVFGNKFDFLTQSSSTKKKHYSFAIMLAFQFQNSKIYKKQGLPIGIFTYKEVLFPSYTKK